MQDLSVAMKPKVSSLTPHRLLKNKIFDIQKNMDFQKFAKKKT